jgi:hypothetical protein
MQTRAEPAITAATKSTVTDQPFAPPSVAAVAVTRKTRVGWNPDRIKATVSATSKVLKDTANASPTSLQSANAATTDSSTAAAAVRAESVTDKSASALAVSDSVTANGVTVAAPPRKTNTKVRALRLCKHTQSQSYS